MQNAQSCHALLAKPQSSTARDSRQPNLKRSKAVFVETLARGCKRFARPPKHGVALKVVARTSDSSHGLCSTQSPYFPHFPAAPVPIERAQIARHDRQARRTIDRRPFDRRHEPDCRVLERSSPSELSAENEVRHHAEDVVFFGSLAGRPRT